MYKNQLQELAQRSCFNLPSYSCIREGPDHAPRFKATVNFNGETFESPTFCSTLRLAEHAAAEVALNTLASRGPSRALIAGVLDETGVYKNLLQETAHRAGLKLPVYTTIRSGPGHVPVFSCTVELAGMSFIGEPARTKKQAQKNAAMTAWSSLKRLVQHSTPSSNSSTSSSPVEAKRSSEEQEQVVIARILASLQPAGIKNSKQSDSQRGQERFIPVCKELTPPIPTLYPVQCQGWAYPSFTPEMAIYQMWQQEELFQLQNRRLLAFQVPPVSPGPQILPYMQSILHSDSVLFGPLREQEPVPVSPRITIATSRPLYLADHHVSDPIKGESKVTIREIHEEKPEESVQCSTSVIPDPPVGNFNAEPRLKDPVDVDDKHMKVELERKDENVQPGDNQTRRFERTSCSNKDSGYRPPDFQAQNMQTFHSSRVNLQHPQRASSLGSFRPASSVAPPVMIRSVRPVPSSTVPPSLNSNMGPPPVPKLQDLAAQIPAPPRMRTGGHSYPASPLPRRMNPGGVRPRFMAPAVRIRSVVPVCSAPPARKMPTSSHEGVVPDRESKDTAAPEDMTTASSELSKLRI